MTLEAKNEADRNGLTILFPKQMLQIFPIVLALVKVGNTLETLLNKICQLIYALLKSIQQYKEFSKVLKQNEHYIYEFWKQ